MRTRAKGRSNHIAARLGALLLCGLLCATTSSGQESSGRAEQYAQQRAALDALRAAPDPDLDQLARSAYSLSPLLREFAGNEETLGILRESFERLPAGHPMRAYLEFPTVDVLVALGRHEEARERLASIEAELVEFGGPEAIRRALRGMLGFVLLDLGLPEQAAPYVHEAYDFEHARLVDPAEEADPGALLAALGTLVELLRMSHRHDTAAERIESLLGDAELLRDNGSMRANLQLLLAFVHMTAGDAGERRARAAAALAAALEDPEILAGARLQGHTLRAYLALLSGDPAGAASDVAVARELESNGAAELAVAEAALLAALGVRLDLERGETPDTTSLERSLERLEATWFDTRPRLGGHSLLHPFVRFAIAEWLLHVERAQGAERALEELARFQSAGSLARLLDARPVRAADVRAHLVPPEGTLLALLPTAERLLRFVVTADAVRLDTVELEGDLERRCRAFERSVRAGRPDLDDGRELRRLLLPTGIERGPVVLVGRDLFAGLPFEALPAGAGEAAMLGAACALSHLPSLPVGQALAQRALRNREPAFDLCLVTNPDFGPAARATLGEDLELRLSGAEIEALSAGIAPERRILLTGARASSAGIADAEPSNGRILHLFTHGVRDAQRDLPTGLALTPSGDDDGLLYADHWLASGAPPLVLLSACGGGSGPARLGDAASTHLGGAFLLGGASCVVLADGDVDQAATHRLMASVQRGLALGATPADALREARAEIHARDSALFRVVGLGHGDVFPGGTGVPVDRERGFGPRTAWWFTAVGVLLGVAVVAASLRSRPRAN